MRGLGDERVNVTVAEVPPSLPLSDSCTPILTGASYMARKPSNTCDHATALCAS